MHKGMFAEEEPRHLRSLDAVERAEPPRIACSREFRREFMRRCHGGERPGAIFGPAGLEAGPIGCRRTGRACAHRRGAEAKGAPCLADGKSPARGGMRARERRRASEGCAAIRASRDRKAAGMEGRPARRRRQARTREEEPIASQAAEIAALKAQAKALKALGEEGPARTAGGREAGEDRGDLPARGRRSRIQRERGLRGARGLQTRPLRLDGRRARPRRTREGRPRSERAGRGRIWLSWLQEGKPPGRRLPPPQAGRRNEPQEGAAHCPQARSRAQAQEEESLPPHRRRRAARGGRQRREQAVPPRAAAQGHLGRYSLPARTRWVRPSLRSNRLRSRHRAGPRGPELHGGAARARCLWPAEGNRAAGRHPGVQRPGRPLYRPCLPRQARGAWDKPANAEKGMLLGQCAGRAALGKDEGADWRCEPDAA